MNSERHMAERQVMNYCQEEICIPRGEEYRNEIDTAVRRRTVQESTQENLSMRRSYDIEGKRFIVRSVFDAAEKKTPADAIRRLIDLKYENVS